MQNISDKTFSAVNCRAIRKSPVSGGTIEAVDLASSVLRRPLASFACSFVRRHVRSPFVSLTQQQQPPPPPHEHAAARCTPSDTWERWSGNETAHFGDASAGTVAGRYPECHRAASDLFISDPDARYDSRPGSERPL